MKNVKTGSVWLSLASGGTLEGFHVAIEVIGIFGRALE